MLIHTSHQPMPPLPPGAHVLLPAEVGFSALSSYARDVPRETLRAFADKVNALDEPGAVTPRVSALPRRYFRDVRGEPSEQVIADFQRHILAFLDANERTIQARVVFFVFCVGPGPVPTRYLSVTEELLLALPPDSVLQEAVLVRHA